MQVTYPEVEETVENEAKVLDFLFHKRAGMRTSLKSSTTIVSKTITSSTWN